MGRQGYWRLCCSAESSASVRSSTCGGDGPVSVRWDKAGPRGEIGVTRVAFVIQMLSTEKIIVSYQR